MSDKKILDTKTGLDLTAPQTRALETLRAKGEVAVDRVKEEGLDHRALKALIRLLPSVVILTATAYTIVRSEDGSDGSTTATTMQERDPGDTNELTAEERVVADTMEAEVPFGTTEPEVVVAKISSAKKERAKKEPRVGESCLCGCGGTTKPGSRFICGHDSKLHAVIRKIDRGEGGLELLPPGDKVLEWLSSCSWLGQHPKFAEIIASARLPEAPAAEKPTDDVATASSEGEEAQPPVTEEETAPATTEGEETVTAS